MARQHASRPAPDEKDPLLTQKYMTVQEVAEALRLAKMTVYRMIHTGEIEGVVKFGRSFRIPENSVSAFVTDCGFDPSDI